MKNKPRYEKLFAAPLPIALALSLSCGAAARADDQILYEKAVQEYKAKNYDAALKDFQTYLKDPDIRPEALYYVAIISQQTGRIIAARRAYALIIKSFPGTEMCTLARKGLAQVDAVLAPGPAVLPRETWVPFTRRGRSMIVEAKVNNHDIPVVFDTGAERCAFNFTQFRQLGLPMPSGPPADYSVGVGKAEPEPVWLVKVDLQVGHIVRHSFPVVVGNMALPNPLLGQDFYSGLEYTIDSSNNAISFKKQELGSGTVLGAAAPLPAFTVDSSGKYVYNVPFTLSGECAVVKVTLNGVELPMIFDTGAEGSLLTSGQARAAGVALDGRMLKVSGIGGSTLAAFGVIRSIKLGPIEKHNVRIPVTDKIGIKESLIGQDIMRGWHFTIDKSAKIIRFTRGESSGY